MLPCLIPECGVYSQARSIPNSRCTGARCAEARRDTRLFHTPSIVPHSVLYTPLPQPAELANQMTCFMHLARDVFTTGYGIHINA